MQHKAQVTIKNPDDLPLLTAAASLLEPILRRKVTKTILAAKNSISLEQLENALRRRHISDVEAASRLRAMASGVGTALRTVLPQGFRTGGRVGNQVLRNHGIRLNLNLLNPYSTAFILQHVPTVVEGITQTGKERIQEIVHDAFVLGIPPGPTARRIRDHIGLTRHEATIADNAARNWEGQGVTGQSLERRKGLLVESLIRRRALRIARTEIMLAHNTGQQAIWREARVKGLLDSSRTHRMVIVTHDDRLDLKICEPMDGEKVGLEQAFSSGHMHPPFHPNCRCTVGLVFAPLPEV